MAKEKRIALVIENDEQVVEGLKQICESDVVRVRTGVDEGGKDTYEDGYHIYPDNSDPKKPRTILRFVASNGQTYEVPKHRVDELFGPVKPDKSTK
jgi:hypothetical protein